MRKKKNRNQQNFSGPSYYQGESRFKESLTGTNGLASDDYFQGKIDDQDENYNNLQN